ncbi:hypothetical protein ACFCXT_05060 [Streptomyces vinaceus]
MTLVYCRSRLVPVLVPEFEDPAPDRFDLLSIPPLSPEWPNMTCHPHG